jgi:hypothetical protein
MRAEVVPVLKLELRAAALLDRQCDGNVAPLRLAGDIGTELLVDQQCRRTLRGWSIATM